MNGRIYDPLLGRMLSADPKIPNPASLQGFNRYTYVYNNPLGLVDPEGFDPTPPLFVQYQMAAFQAGHGKEFMDAANANSGAAAQSMLLAGLGYVPWLGDAVGLKMDYDTFKDPTANWWGEKGIAALDVGLTILSAGVLPNVMPERRAVGVIENQVETLEKQAKAASDAAELGADVAHAPGSNPVHKVTEAPVPAQVEVSNQPGIEGATRAAPTAGNYRGRYNAQRHAEGKPRLPDSFDAHHSIPQEYRGHKDFKDFDFDAPENIQGVKGNRADVNTHQDITNDWSAFREANPEATGDQILKFAQEMDEKYKNDWIK